jgi:hypothetical protein
MLDHYLTRFLHANRCPPGSSPGQAFARKRSSQAARTFLTGCLALLNGLMRRLAPSSSVRPSKNWMISRQGSHLNMLRDAAAFDISFRQPGQSGFIEDVEIEDIKILCCRNLFWVRERGFRPQLKQQYQDCFFRRGERC